MDNTNTQLTVGNNPLPTIHKEKFELALKKLEDLSKKGDFNIKYEKFKTDGGLFGLGDHKVTGSEINENLVSPLQKNLNSIQDNIKNLYKTSQEIYKTFDALDKEYISGILTSVGMANETSNQALAASLEAKEANRKAEIANNDIKRTIEALKQTVNAIKNLKVATSLSQFSNISGLTHVSDIDSIWEDVAAQKNHTAALNAKLTALVDTLNESKNVIQNDLEAIREDVAHQHAQFTDKDNSLQQAISEAKDGLSKDINSNQNEILGIGQQLSSLKLELSDAEKTFREELNILKAFQNVLENYRHLADVDSIYEKTEHNEGEITAIDGKLSDFIAETHDMGSALTTSLRNAQEESRKESAAIKTQLTDFAEGTRKKEEALTESLKAAQEENQKNLSQLDGKLSDFITETRDMESALTTSLREAQEESRKESAAIKTQLTDFAEDTKKKEEALTESLKAAQEENQKNLSQLDGKLDDFITETHEKESALEALLHKAQEENKKEFAAINEQLNTFVDETHKKEDAFSESIRETQTNFDVFRARTEKRMKIAYAIGGVATVLALTQLILLLTGVL